MATIVLRQQLTARRPSEKPPRNRHYRAPLLITDEEREERAVRCATCHCRVVLPCYACWLARYQARDCIYDPRDPSPHRHDRYQADVPEYWTNSQALAVWHAVIEGVDPVEIAEQLELPRKSVVATASAMRQHYAAHPDLFCEEIAAA